MVPLTEVVTFVPPENVNVPELVIALPEPESAPNVSDVTVPCGLLNEVVSVPPSFWVNVSVIVDDPESDIPVI